MSIDLKKHAWTDLPGDVVIEAILKMIDDETRLEQNALTRADSYPGFHRANIRILDIIRDKIDDGSWKDMV